MQTLAGVPQVIPTTASPQTYTNAGTNPEVVHVSTSTTASTVTVAKGGVAIATMTNTAGNFNSATFILKPGEALVLTYSAGTPVIVRDTLGFQAPN